jgi:hypothetical protein
VTTSSISQVAQLRRGTSPIEWSRTGSDWVGLDRAEIPQTRAKVDEVLGRLVCRRDKVYHCPRSARVRARRECEDSTKQDLVLPVPIVSSLPESVIHPLVLSFRAVHPSDPLSLSVRRKTKSRSSPPPLRPPRSPPPRPEPLCKPPRPSRSRFPRSLSLTEPRGSTTEDAIPREGSLRGAWRCQSLKMGRSAALCGGASTISFIWTVPLLYSWPSACGHGRVEWAMP